MEEPFGKKFFRVVDSMPLTFNFTKRKIPITEKPSVVFDIPPNFLQPKNIFGTAMTTPAMISKEDVPITGEFLKNVGQSIARNIGSAGVTIAEKIAPKELRPFVGTLKSQDFPSFWGQGLFETIFGKEEIKSIEERIAEAEPKVKKWQEELEKVSQTPELSGKEKLITTVLANADTPTITFLGIMGSVGLDLTPFGGLEKNAFKALREAKTTGDALILLQKMGVADDIARQFAEEVVKVTDDKTAKTLFTPRVAPAGMGKFPTIHEGGKIKMVEGTPVKIIDGVETFLHKGDGGWIVSEASTGRFISESRTSEGAIAKAHFNIDQVGKDKFLEFIKKRKLSDQAVKEITPELELLAQEAKKIDFNTQYNIDYAQKYGIRRLEHGEIVKKGDVGYIQPGAKKFTPTEGLEYDANQMHPIYRKIAPQDVKPYYLGKSISQIPEPLDALAQETRKIDEITIPKIFEPFAKQNPILFKGIVKEVLKPKYENVDKFKEAIGNGIVIRDEFLPGRMQDLRANLEQARKSGSIDDIQRATKALEDAVLAVDITVRETPFRLVVNNVGKVEVAGVDIKDIKKGVYEPTILGKRISAIKTREVPDMITELKRKSGIYPKQKHGTAMDPVIAREQIAILEEIKSGVGALTDFYNQAVKGVKEITPAGIIPETKIVPKTIEDFDRLAFEEQEKVFDFLPPELQAKIVGGEITDIGLSPIKKLADDIVTGKIKVRVPEGIKTEALLELGSANYARIFRKDKIFSTLDELASDIGIASDDLIREISGALDRQGITNRTLIRARAEIREVKLPQLRQRTRLAKDEIERQRFIKEFQREITGELTKKRFSLLQKAKGEEKAFQRGEKIGVQEFKRQERILTAIQKDITRTLEAPKGKERSRISFIKQLGEFNQTAIQDAKRQLDIIKPIREMNLQELRSLAGEMKTRLKFKFERGFKVSTEIAEKLRIQPKDSPKPVFDEGFYQKNLEVKTEKPPRLEGIKKFIEGVTELADRLGGSISTRLKNINPILKTRLRKYEFDVRMAIKKDRDASSKLLEEMQNIKKTPEDFWTLDLALKNGDEDSVLRTLRKHGLEEEYNKVKVMLDDLWTRADEVGFDIGYQKNYWPRQIKDSKGFLTYLRGTETWSLIDEAIKRKEMDLGRFLTEEEQAGLVNTMIRGYRGGQITLSKTGAMKERVLDFITPELNRFYQDSDKALLNYIERTNDAIEARRFFGKQRALEGADKEALNNIQDSIGTFVADLMAKGEITPLQEIELRQILEARFNPAKTGFTLGLYKNLAYIDTLGSVTNAITQLGDLAFAMYKGGPIRGLHEALNSALGKARITKEDIGFAQREISAELERQGLGGFLDRLFRITGFTKIDRMGAEGLINSTIRKAQQEAVKNSTRLRKELEAIFPEKLFGKEALDNALRELANGEITDNVKFYALNVLLDFSPRALSEMPEMYLRSGNGRIFYILKTWTLKLFDVYRNEVFQVMKTDKVQGVKNALELGILLFAMNATVDEIKDWMRGRETNLSDTVVNNLAKLVGFSRYHTTQIAKEGLASTLGAELVPPLPIVDSISKDVIGLFKDFDKAKELSSIRTLREIPIGGELFYWWFGPGAESKEKDAVSSVGGLKFNFGGRQQIEGIQPLKFQFSR